MKWSLQHIFAYVSTYFRIHLQHEKDKCSQLERDRDEYVALRHKFENLEAELKSTVSSRQQAINEAERLKDALRLARADAESAKLNAVKSSKDAERCFSQKLFVEC